MSSKQANLYSVVAAASPSDHQVSEYSIPTEVQKQKWAQKQSEMKSQLVLQDDHPEWSVQPTTYISLKASQKAIQGLRYVGGVDLSFIVGNNEDAIASLIVLSFPDLKVVYEDHIKVKLTLPYIAGFLAFREVDPLLSLIQSLRVKRPELVPQVILVDGCGILHPRGFGLASHLGLVSGIPTVGCSKNYLVIDGDGPLLATKPTELKALFHKHVQDESTKGVMYLEGQMTGKVYGAALAAQTKSGEHKNAIFVSIGHRVSLETSLALVRACSLYRVPEPIRQADLKSRSEIRKWVAKDGAALLQTSKDG
ncbi:hypothetical protein BGZ73_000773 [Actinomortierella ambigua]|nr:hypothetical protein BGZ73_000773 [Actinomortierella ambigua]